MDQVVQIAGALMILAAFAGAQFRRIGVYSPTYLALNLVGGAILAVLALYEEQWGFLLLETVWTAVSAWSLVRVLRGVEPAASH